MKLISTLLKSMPSRSSLFLLLFTLFAFVTMPAKINAQTALNFTGTQVTTPIQVPALETANSAFTVEMWVKPGTMDKGTPVCFSNNGGTTGKFFIQIYDPTGNGTGTSLQLITFFYGTSVGASLPGTLVKNTWNHIAVTANPTSGDFRVYVNGSLVSTYAGGPFTNSNASGVFVKMGNQVPGGEFYTGAVDELRVWQGTRTTAEILANYNKSFSASVAAATPNLLVDVNFENECPNTQLTNLATNNGVANQKYNINGATYAGPDFFPTDGIAVSGSLCAFTGCFGTASTSQSFTVSATSLTANLVVTAPTGYEVSLSSGGTYSSSLTLTQSGGSVASTPVYIRLANTANGTPSGYVTLSSAGSATKNLIVSGTVNSLPMISQLGATSLCISSTVTLTAQSNVANPTYNWYDAASGGNLLYTGATVTTGVLSSTTTYYAQLTDANGCNSSRQAITLQANTRPTVSNVTGNTTICSTGNTTLTASSSNPSAVYRWYTAGGSLLSNSASYTTPALNSNTTYNVEVIDGSNGCVSSSRYPVTVTVNPASTISGISGTTTICAGVSTTLTASSSASSPTYNWYDAATGGNLLFTGASYQTPALSGTTTYYVDVNSGGSCTSSRTSVTVTVNATPSVSGVSGTTTICSGNTTTLTASSAAPSPTYKWYTAATGGTLLFTGASYTTPALNSTTTYYVEVTNAGGCASSRFATTVTVNAKPAATITASGSTAFCNGGSVTLSASAGTGYSWSTGATTQSIIVSATGSYTVTVSSNGCSATSSATGVTVNPIPTITIGGSTGICTGNTATLSASSNQTVSFNWYDAATGGNLLATGANFTTPVLTASTTYYAEAVNGTCTSGRTAVVVNVTTINAQSVSSSVSSICGTGSATISLPSSQVGVNYVLRDNANNNVVAGPVAGTGSAISFNTGNISNTTTYNVYGQTGSSGALNFNGGEYVTTSLSDNPNTSWTLSAWVKPSYFPNGGYSGLGNTIIGADLSSNWGDGMGMNASEFKVMYNNGWTSFSYPFSVNTWYHVTAVIDINAGNVKAYVNGNLIGTNWVSFSLGGSSTVFKIGYNPGVSSDPFAGVIDEVSLWNTVKSASEIQAYMNSCLVGTEPGLVSLYKFDDGSGNNALDATGNSTGVLNGFNSNAWTDGKLNCGTGAVCNQQMSNTQTITVYTKPTVASITGGNKACPSSTIQLADATSGGVWSSSNTAVATVDANGLVTTLSAGTVTISYTVTGNGGCTASATQVLTIAPITTTFTNKPSCENTSNGTATVSAHGGGGGSKYYGTTGNQNNAQLVSFDVSTGTATVIGNTGLGGGIPAVAVSPSGDIYAMTSQYPYKRLFKIDPNTGVATQVGNTDNNYCSAFPAMAFNSAGVLYAFDRCGWLYTINTSTGVFTTVGTPGQVSYTGMQFDPTDGSLYAVNQSNLYKLDPNTGYYTQQWYIGYGRISDIVFDASGQLYGINGGGYGSNEFFKIDKTNGSTTFVGYPSVGNIAGLAGGGTSYTYLWDNGQTTSSATNLSAGTHSVTVTDVNGCSSTSTVTITEQPKPTLFTVTGGGAFCNGSQGVQVGLSGSENGINYQLKVDGNNTGSVYTGNGGPIDFGYQYSAGTYTVEASNSQIPCTQMMTGSVAVVVNPLPDGTVTYTGANTICQNATLLLQAATGTGYTYQWIKDGNDIAGATSATYAAGQTGYYSVRITTAAGCSNNYFPNVYLTVFPTPVITVNGSTAFCSGYTRTLSSDNGNGLFSNYTWSNEQSGNSITVGSSGTFTVTASNGTCSATSAPVTITASPNTLAVTATLTSPTACFNTCDGSVSLAITGGTAPYQTGASYDFSGNAIDNSLFMQNSGNFSQSNGQLVATYDGNYNGWGNYLSTVRQFPGDQDLTYEATFQGGNEEYAFGLTDALSTSTSPNTIKLGFYRYNSYGYFIVDGGYQYQFQLPDVNASYDFKIEKSGTDVRFYTRTTGGVYTLGYTISYNNSPASFRATAMYYSYPYYSGFTSDNWNIGSVAKTTGLCPGVYTYKVYDAAGCFATTTINVPVTTAPGSLQLAAAVTAPATCANTCDGSVSLTPSGGTGPYTFGFNSTFSGNTLDNNLFTTTNGVFSQSNGVLMEGFAGGYTGWNNVIQTNSSFSTAGNLSYEASFQSTSGYNSNIIFGLAQEGGISQPNDIKLGFEFTGNYIYAWINGSTYSNTYINDVNAWYDFKVEKIGTTVKFYYRQTGSGAYTLLYTYNNWTGAAKLKGAAIDYSYYYYGNTGYNSDNWSINFNPPTTGLCPGVPYTYMVFDATGCAAVATITVPVSDAPGALKLTATATGASCDNGCSGSISLVPSGGTAPYSYGSNYNFSSTPLTDLFTLGSQSSFRQENGEAISTNPNQNSYGYWNNNISSKRQFDASSNLSFEGTFKFINGNNGNLSAFGFTDKTGSDLNDPNQLFFGFREDYGNLYAYYNKGQQQQYIGYVQYNTYYDFKVEKTGSTLNYYMRETGSGAYNLVYTANGANYSGMVSAAALSYDYNYYYYYYYYNYNYGSLTTKNWTIGAEPKTTNVCPGTYTYTVYDATGCAANATVTVLADPQIFTVTTTTTNLSAPAVCDGTVSFSSSQGGTLTPVSKVVDYPFSGTSLNTSLFSTQNGNFTESGGSLRGATGYNYTGWNNTITSQQTFASVGKLVFESSFSFDNNSNVSFGFAPANAQITDQSNYPIAIVNSGGSQIYSNEFGNWQYLGNYQTNTWYDFKIELIGTVINYYSRLSGNNNAWTLLRTSSYSGSETSFKLGTTYYDYAYYGYGGFNTKNWKVTGNAPTTGLCAGTYNYTVYSEGGCSKDVSFTIAGETALTATNQTVNPSCYGSNNGSITITAAGGTAPYTYSIDGETFVSTNTFSNLSAGQYNVIVKDAANATTTQTVVLTEPAQVIATTTQSGAVTFCEGGSVTLTSSAATGNVWSTNETTQSITVNTSGTYSVIVTVNGCSANSAPVTVTVNPLPVATITADGATTFCAGGSVNLTASAGASYLWSNNATTQSINVTGSGNYSVKVTNANGCSATSAVTGVTVNPLPAATITADAATTFCAGGSVNLTASAGASYLWSNNATTQSINVTSGGDYTVTVTSADGCSATSSATTVTVNPLPVATITADGATTFCAGGSVNLTASAGASYLWSNNATTQTINVNTAGSYTVTVTNAEGCSTTSSATVTSLKPQPTVNTVANQEVCHNGTPTAAISFSGAIEGTVYNWTNNTPSIGLAASGTGDIASFLAQNTGNTPVTATITVTPSYDGCTGTPVTFTIRVNPIPTFAAIANQTLCNGAASSSVTFVGQVAGTTYQWFGGAAIGLANGNGGTIPSFTAVNAGTSAVTANILVISNAAGASISCGTSRQFSITVNPTPSVSTVTGSTAVCLGASASLTASSAVSNTTFNWYDAATGGNLLFTGDTYTTPAINAATTYYVESSASGCVSSSRYAVGVTINTAPTVSGITGTKTICSGTTTTLTAASAAAGAVFNWYDAATGGTLLYSGAAYTTPALTANTTYYVEVVSGAGCVAASRSSVTVSVTTINDQSITTAVSAVCGTGSTTVNLASSQVGVNYTLRNNANNAVVAGPVSGTGGAISFNTGTISATTTYNVFAQTAAGGGLKFDGLNKFVNLNYNTGTLGIAGNSFTVSAWIYRTDQDGRDQEILGNIGGCNLHLILRSNRVYLGFCGNDLAGNTVIGQNQWYHISYVYNKTTGTQSIYVNGALDASGNGHGALANDGSILRIGGYGSAGNTQGKFAGTIDEMQIWNSALSASQISANMNTCLTGSESGLLAYFNFDEGTGTTLTDKTGHGFSGTLANMTNADWTSGKMDCSGGISCSLQLSTTPTVTVNALPNVTVSASATALCTGSSVTLSGNGASTYSWSGGITNGVAFVPSATSTYTVTGTDANGCSNTASQTITVNALPVVTVSTATPAICIGNSATISTTTNLVGYWKFDEGSGNTVADLSGNNMNGTFVGGSGGWAASTAFSGAGTAATFGSKYIQVADNAAINNMQSHFTIEAWVYQTDNSNNTIVDRSNYNFLFEINPNGTPGLGFYNPNDGWSYSTTSIPANQWVHVACTWDGATRTLKFYKNGVQTDVFVRNNQLYFNAGEINIGRQSPQTCACNIMTGNIDELRLWSVVKSQSEIAAAMGGPVAVSSPATFTWSPSTGLNTTTGSTVIATPSETTTYTITATNSNNCVSTATQTITVNPLPDATITASGATTFCVGGSVTLTASAGASYQWSTGAVTQSINVTTGGNYTVKVTNAQGCSKTSAATTVTIDPLPTITCGGTVTANAAANQCGANVTYPAATATAGSGAVTITYSRASGSFFNVGNTVVTATATDACGNVASCNFTVSVVDNLAPVPTVATLPVITGECSASVSAPTAQDNCTGLILGTTSDAVTFTEQGTYTITWSYNDGRGNISTQTQTVIVKDVTAPIVSGPADVNTGNSYGSCGAYVYFSQPTATDNCSTGAFNFFNGGEPNDAGGEDYLQLYNSGTWNDLPNIGGLRYIVEFNSINTAPIPGYSLIGTFGGHTYFISNGTNNWTGARAAALSIGGDLTSINTLEEDNFLAPYGGATWVGGYQDHSDPSYVEPGNAYQNFGGWKWVDGTRLGIGTINIVQTTGLPSGSLFPLGTTVNTWTATDQAGNVATYTQTIVVTDQEGPYVYAPDINVNPDANKCTAVVNYDLAGSMTDCTPGQNTISYDIPSGSIFPIGTTMVTVTTVDVLGNVKFTYFNVNVNDITAPVITAPALITVNNDPGQCGAVVNFIATAEDCSATTITYSVQPGTQFGVGVTPVTVTASDIYGNTSTVVFNVTVIDNEPPIITNIPANISTTADNNTCGAVVTYTAPIATENCSSQTRVFNYSGAQETFVVPAGVTSLKVDMAGAGGANGLYGYWDAVAGNGGRVQATLPVTPGQVIYLNVGGMGKVAIDGYSSPGGYNGGGNGASYSYYYYNGGGGGGATDIRIGGTDLNSRIIVAGGGGGGGYAGFGGHGGGLQGAPGNSYYYYYGYTPGDGGTQTDPGANYGTGNPSGFGVGGDGYGGTQSGGGGGGWYGGGGAGYWSSGGGGSSYTGPSVTDVLHTQGYQGSDGYVSVSWNSPLTVTQTTGLPSGSLFPVGVTTNTFVATDAAGNQSTASFTVTVTDDQLPVITAVPDIAVTNDLNKCGASVSITAPAASDNCSIASVIGVRSDALAINADYPIGTTTIVWTATDASGNISTFTQKVTVTDVQPPVIVCPGDMNVYATTAAGAVVNYTTPVGTDNCSGTTTVMTAGLASGATFPIGTTTVTYMVTDVAGLTANCSFNVNVTGLPPVIACPANITVSNAPGQCGANVSFAATETNAIPASTISYSIAPGSFFPVGTTTVTATAVNPVGTSTCTFTVTVTDDEKPIVHTNNITVQLDGNGSVSITTAQINNASSDNCAVASYSLDKTSFNCSNLGANTVTLTVTDIHGNTNTATAIVTVQDKLGPVPTVNVLPTVTGQCSANIIIVGSTCSDNCRCCRGGCHCHDNCRCHRNDGRDHNRWYSNSWWWNYDNDDDDDDDDCENDADDYNTYYMATPTAMDNCSGLIKGTTTDPLHYNTQGTYTIHWKFTDANGNSTIQTQTVIVADTQAPIPWVTNLPTISGQCSVSVGSYDHDWWDDDDDDDYGIATPWAWDNCAGWIRATTTDPLSYTSQGTYTIHWKFNDGHGNITIQNQTVIVKDNIAPKATVKNLPTLKGSCSVTVTTVPTAKDNCVGIVNGTTTSPLSYTAQGTYTIVWTYTDGRGNTSTQTQTVEVDDDIKPVPQVANLPTVTGACSATVTTIPKANDNCKGVITGTTTDPLTYTAQGTYTIHWTYNDGNGNTTTQNQTVVIDDVTAPVPQVTSLPTLTGECSVTATAPKANDNCKGVVTATTSDATTYTKQGTYTIRWTYNDGNGNTSTQNQTVVVADVTKPTITAPAAATVSCGGSTAPTVNATATDNCSGSIAITYTDVTSGNTITRTWKATDAAGNYSTANQTLTIVDNTAPVITDAKDVTVACGSSTAPSVTGTPKATDNCSTPVLTYSDAVTTSQITRTWTAKDAFGNSSSSVQVISFSAAFSAAITSVPTSSTYTGGVSTNLYLGYGAQSTTLQVGSLPSAGAPYTYAWTGTYTNKLSSTTTSAPVFTPTAFGYYTFNVTVTNKNGCTSSCSISICVTDVRVPGTNGAKIYVTHTPNGKNAVPQTLQVALSSVSSHIGSGGCGSNGNDRLGSADQSPCNTTIATATGITNSNTAKDGETVVTTATDEDLKVTAMPNPTTTFFTLKIESRYQTPVELRVMDGRGRVVDAKSKIGANSTIQIGHNYSSGTYYAELIQGTQRKVVQLIKGRG